MKRTKMHYDKVFREKAIHLAIHSSQPLSETAKELGINPATLYKWIKRTQTTNLGPATSSHTLVLLKL